MLIDCFPVVGLRLSTPRLELRLPEGEELAAMAEVAAAGVHDPEYMPFVTPWTQGTAEQVKQRTVLHHWKRLGEWTAQDWRLNLTVFFEGAPIGLQNLRATDFAVTRSVGSGSWLGRSFQGRGLGAEMRAAVLHLAFAGLGAEEAVSVAFSDNAASQGVSAKLGYVPAGVYRRSAGGTLRFDQRLVLTREAWERHRKVEVEIEGLEPC